MNRLDPVSGQIVAPVRASGHLPFLLTASLAVPAASVVLVVWLATLQASNPTDLVVLAFVNLNLTVMLVDLWALGLAVFRSPVQTPLRVPPRTPLVLAGGHLLLWLLALQFSPFHVLYHLEPVNEVIGHYAVRGWLAGGLVVLAALSAVSAGLEARLVRWVLISEKTAKVEPADSGERPAEADMPVGDEHLYEAQMMLEQLGFGPLEVDGEGGAQTRDALERFQESCGLAATGELSVLTLVELRNRWSEGRKD